MIKFIIPDMQFKEIIMDEFQQTGATGMVHNYEEPISTKKSLFKIIYDFIPTSIIILLLGFTIGIWWANNTHNQKVADSVKLQRFLYKTTVYNITPNVEISK